MLKFPGLFYEQECTELPLSKVMFDDIYDFVNARKENLGHLQQFIKEFKISA
jgi:hypothetical protein